MTLTKKILSVSGAAALALSALSTPLAVQAETSASMSFANMYLWRGQNISPNGAQIAGSLDYSHESGAYAGIWTSSEDAGHETDLYFGFGGEASGFTYDISYWWYLYPEERVEVVPPGDVFAQLDLGDTDAAELVFSGGYGPVTVTYFMQVDSDNDDNNYLTIAFSHENIGLTFGMWDLEDPDSGDEYSHLTFTYSPLDELSFSISKASSDRSDDFGVEEDPLFQIMYSKNFSLVGE